MDEIDESFQNITFEDSHVEVDFDNDTPPEEQTRDTEASLATPGTPSKKQDLTYQPGKHALTPESKLAAETNPKRLAKHVQPGNLSSKQCTDRRLKLSEEIENVVVVSNYANVFVTQCDLIKLLDLTDADKSLLTRCVTASFPESMKKTITTKKQKQVVYTNISWKSKTLPTSNIVKELFSGASNEISELQKQVTQLEQIMVQEWEVLSGELDANNIPEANIAASKYKSKFEQYTNLNTVLVKLYENELDKLQKMHAEDQISTVQKKQILLE